jgi:hypothetical protein
MPKNNDKVRSSPFIMWFESDILYSQVPTLCLHERNTDKLSRLVWKFGCSHYPSQLTNAWMNTHRSLFLYPWTKLRAQLNFKGIHSVHKSYGFWYFHLRRAIVVVIHSCMIHAMMACPLVLPKLMMSIPRGPLSSNRSAKFVS